MRFWFGLVVIAAVLPTAVNAQCIDWSADTLALSDWSAQPADEPDTGVYRLSVEVENISGQGMRMAEARVYFQDPLERSIVWMKLHSDLTLAEGDATTQEWPRIVGERSLANISREDVTAWICVQSVVYDDGTVERFD